MMMLAYTLLEMSSMLAMSMAITGMFLALIRLMLGPSLADRVVALDTIGVLSVGVIAAYDVFSEQPVLLDAATAVALVAFLATVAFAHYVQRQAFDE